MIFSRKATNSENSIDQDEKQSKNFAKDLMIIIVLCIIASFFIRTFLVQTFYIPSQSMQNTLQIGDRILVNLLAPDLVPIQRGDVVVFKDEANWLSSATKEEQPWPLNWVTSFFSLIKIYPDTSNQYVVKRVIGKAGDNVKCCSEKGKITVNGQEIDEPYIYQGDDPSIMEFDVTVPEGRLWVLGDHRSDSKDSRYNRRPFIEESSVAGRAFTLVWPLNRISWLGNYSDVFKNIPDPIL